MNLLMNGIQATSAVTGRRHELRIQSQEHGPDHILVAVEDTGSTGIEPQNVDRLFSAFFTTKPDGLICRSIVEQHGDNIWGTPNSRVGSTFQFTLCVRGETSS